MVRHSELQEKLLHLIGWKQGPSLLGASICKTLTESESGLYFQQAHPLITLDNLLSIAPDFSKLETNGVYAEYNALARTSSYKKGTVVSYAGQLYKAVQDTIPGTPDQLPDYWAPTSSFSEWLESKTKDSITKAITRFCTEKAAEHTAKALCEDKILFDGTGRLTDTVPNRSNIVGFEIVPLRSRGVTLKINRIGLQFTEPGLYTLYLMHSSLSEPVRIISLNKQIKGFEWFSVSDLLLPYTSTDIDAGGSWYLCYKQTELPSGSLAIRKDRDWSKGPCQACSRKEFMAWQAWSKYMEVHPFSVKEQSAEGPFELWDISNNNYEYATNFGINLDISVYCDLTDFIISNRSLFQDILLKQLAVDILREFAFNPSVRTNRHSINASKLDILYELDGDSSSLKKAGLNYQLDLAYKAAKLDTQGIDRVCLPCKNNGVKYRVV